MLSSLTPTAAEDGAADITRLLKHCHDRREPDGPSGGMNFKQASTSG